MGKKIRINDEVVILAGKDKGKKGKIKSVFPEGKVIVSGINLVSKHKKPIPSINYHGGIIKEESKINISNVAIFNSNINKFDRVGFSIIKDKKVRIFKSNKKIIRNL